VRTSRITVFTVPPRNVTLELGNQPAWRRAVGRVREAELRELCERIGVR
jgi:hypothetical protein